MSIEPCAVVSVAAMADSAFLPNSFDAGFG
jgi:hypothetical protein